MADPLQLLVYGLAIVAIEVHQVDSGAEAEWEILHVPGGRPAFMVVHGLLVTLMVLGIVLVARGDPAGARLGVATGLGGAGGALVHVALWQRGEPHFRARSSVVSVAAMGLAGLLALVTFLPRLGTG